MPLAINREMEGRFRRRFSCPFDNDAVQVDEEKVLRMEFPLGQARRGNDDKAVVAAVADITVTGSHQSALLHGLSDGTECFLSIQAFVLLNA